MISNRANSNENYTPLFEDYAAFFNISSTDPPFHPLFFPPQKSESINSSRSEQTT
jgi:hypothetical protein